MMPPVQHHGSGRRDVAGVHIHPADAVGSHQVDLQPAVREQEAETLAPRGIQERLRGDRPAGRVGLDPRRHGERVPAAAVVGEAVGIRLLQVGVEPRPAAAPRGPAIDVPGPVEAALRLGRQREIAGHSVLEVPEDRIRIAERCLPFPLRLLDRRPQLGQPLFRRRDSIVERLQLRLLFRVRHMHERRRVADVLRQAGLGNAVEIRVELIELLLAERIELVVVAARAPHRQPEPYGPRRRDAIDDGFHEVFVLGRTTLRRHAGIAVEAAGDLLLQRRVRQHVARELLDREPIEGQVPIEGADDPVAPRPHLLPLIEVQPVRVREACRRQPMHGHPFAVAG